MIFWGCRLRLWLIGVVLWMALLTLWKEGGCEGGGQDSDPPFLEGGNVALRLERKFRNLKGISRLNARGEYQGQVVFPHTLIQGACSSNNPKCHSGGRCTQVSSVTKFSIPSYLI